MENAVNEAQIEFQIAVHVILRRHHNYIREISYKSQLSQQFYPTSRPMPVDRRGDIFHSRPHFQGKRNADHALGLHGIAAHFLHSAFDQYAQLITVSCLVGQSNRQQNKDI